MNIPSLTLPFGLSGSSSPEKLTFTPMSKDLKKSFEPFKVLFNPTSYSISKSASWSSTADSDSGQAKPDPKAKTNFKSLDAPTLYFGGGANRQLSLNLFYDVTEQPGKDVRKETNKIVALTLIDRNEQCPPPVKISWGSSQQPSDFPFTGVITNLNQQFTLFDSNGVPLRANLTVTVMEYPDPEENLRRIDPELTTRIVKRGDTLSSISAEVYGNPGMWRLVAEANHIENPMVLKTGSRLVIPKVE